LQELHPEMDEPGQAEVQGNVVRYFQIPECFDMMTMFASGTLFFQGSHDTPQ
jgi:hypothetical protein